MVFKKEPIIEFMPYKGFVFGFLRDPYSIGILFPFFAIKILKKWK